MKFQIILLKAFGGAWLAVEAARFIVQAGPGWDGVFGHGYGAFMRHAADEWQWFLAALPGLLAIGCAKGLERMEEERERGGALQVRESLISAD